MSKSSSGTAFLKECMADALIELLSNAPPEQITIRQITETAGVGRATWFRHFSSKSEALSFKLICSWERWAEEHWLKERRRYSVDNAETFFQYNASMRHTLETIYKAGLRSAVFDAFFTVMGAQCGADPTECYQSRFYSNGLYGLLDEWIRRGFYETPEEMAEMFRRMVGVSNE